MSKTALHVSKHSEICGMCVRMCLGLGRECSLLADVTLSVFELHSSILTTDLREDKELGEDRHSAKLGSQQKLSPMSFCGTRICDFVIPFMFKLLHPNHPSLPPCPYSVVSHPRAICPNFPELLSQHWTRPYSFQGTTTCECKCVYCGLPSTFSDFTYKPEFCILLS